MLKKLPFLLCLLFTGCQVAELVGPSLAGLVAYPVVRLKEAFEKDSDDFYDKTIKDREKAKKEQEELLCAEKEGDLEKAAALLTCSGCAAWVRPSNAPDSRCTKECRNWCDRVCPSNFDILKQSRELAVPYKENTLPIGNFPSDFGDPVIFGGYCNGFTQFQKNIAALAVFRPEKKPPHTDPKNLKAYYRGILDNIVDGKVQEIPGFATIRDFTSDPLVQPYVQQAVRDSWAKSNFYNPFLVESVGVYTKTSESEFREAQEDVRRMIEMTGSAQITISTNDEKGKKAGHTVEAYHLYEKQDGDTHYHMACVRDNNENWSTYKTKAEWEQNPANTDPLAADGVYCPKPLIIRKEKKGEAVWRRFVKVDKMDKRSAVDNMEAVRGRCKKEMGCD